LQEDEKEPSVPLELWTMKHPPSASVLLRWMVMEEVAIVPHPQCHDHDEDCTPSAKCIANEH
jgi:hypothetical protein